MKFCKKCQETKPADAFSKNTRWCRACMSSYYQENKQRILEKRKQYYQENKERINNYISSWREDNPDRVTEYKSSWNKRNTEYYKQWREDNPDRCRLKEEKYRKNNPEKASARAANRRAAKLQRTPVWSETTAINNKYETRPEGHHVDHIIPLQGDNVSGLHVLDNLQHLSARDNRVKGNKFEED